MNRILAYFRRKFTAYLERLGEANKKQFGEDRLECCALNSKKPHDTTA